MGSTIDKNASTSQSKAVIPEIARVCSMKEKKEKKSRAKLRKKQHFVP